MHELLQSEHEVAAAELIDALPEDSRETLLLFYREGQSSLQVAALLGLTDAVVRKRLSRARNQVRDERIRRFGEFARSSSPTAAFTASVVTALGLAAKPAAAASAAEGVAMTAATVGAGKAGGGLIGMAGLGVAVGGGIAAGGIAAHVARRHLLAYADTPDERDRILARYRAYMIVTLPLVIGTSVVMLWTTSAALTLAAALFTEAVSLWTLLAIRRELLPLIARDRARDPEGAHRRYRAYDWTYGPTTIVFSGIAFVLGMPVGAMALSRTVPWVT
jgi:hypothetical protein